MNEIDKIREKINNRIVCIMSHGKSIETLETRITEFKDLDICWVSFNLFTVMNKFILSKINKKLDIVLDCAASSNIEYERNYRIPNILNAIYENNTLILSTARLMITQYNEYKLSQFYEINKDIILLVDNIFGRLDYTPNTLFLLIATIAVGKPKKIILFGVDGYSKSSTEVFSTYYKSELQRDRIKNLISTDNPESSLDKSTAAFQERFDWLYPDFCKRCNVDSPFIYNCSINSLITSKWFKQINYNELKGILYV